MALFDVGSLPPWLIPRESPTDALVKGVQAGSAIAHNILAARNFALEQQESIIKQQNSLKLREGLAEFGKYMGQVQDWSSVDAEKGAYDVVARYPWIADTPAFQHGMANFEKARLAKDAIASRERMATERAQVQTDIAELRSADRSEDWQKRMDMLQTRLEAGHDVRMEVQNLRGDQAMAQIEAKSKARIAEHAAEVAGGLNLHEAGGEYWVSTAKGGLHPVKIFNDVEKQDLSAYHKRMDQINKLRDGLSAKSDADKIKQLDGETTQLRGKIATIKNAAEERIKALKASQVTPAPQTPSASEVMGPPNTTAAPEDQELRYAREALAAGIPKDRVAARYKERTGKDFPE